MTLPSRERIEELRELAAFNGRAHVPRPELLALLDCALVMRRLEEWLARPATSINAIRFQESHYGQLAVWLVDPDGNRGGDVLGSDLLSALRAALEEAGAP